MYEHHLPHEIMWNANLMQQGNFIDIFLVRHVGRVYGADGAIRRTAPSAPYTRPTQRLSRQPPVQKLVAGNHLLHLNI